MIEAWYTKFALPLLLDTLYSCFSAISEHTKLLLFRLIGWKHIFEIFVYTISLGTFVSCIAEIL